MHNTVISIAKGFNNLISAYIFIQQQQKKKFVKFHFNFHHKKKLSYYN